MINRIVILTIFLTVSAVFVARASKTEEVPPRESLSGLPYSLGKWTGREATPFEPEILAVLGVDEYVNRVYSAGPAAAGLYIGYYQSQRQGDTIHSPLNCLPGAGWEPLSRTYLPITVSMRPDAPSEDVTVNKYVIRKGLDRQVVLYWYQSHGRVVANEYRSKVLMVYDAVRLNRTDAALVRVVVPITETSPDAENAATALAVDFAKAMFPMLDRYLPS
jgi:EpsI family protein